uniref:Uncharacterized protein n=1 Tax=Acrobeloides nanus TaxID=290746 RepID=A0A914DTA9_9BILA
MRTPNASTPSQKSKSSSPELNIPEEDRISRKLSPAPGMPPSILKDSTGPHRTPMEDTRHRRISDCSPNRNRVKFDVPHSTMRNVSSETDATMPKLNYNTLRNRRQSLPVNTHTALLFKPTSNISEARGLVVDMLANRDLPPNVATCLRAVASLLNPQTNIQNFSLADLGLPKVVENPYSGEQLTVSAVGEKI